METAKQIVTVKNNIAEKFPNFSQEKKDYIFLRLMGNATYDDWKWRETADPLDQFFYSREQLLSGNNDISTIGLFEKLGLSPDQAKKLRYNLRLQNDLVDEKRLSSDSDSDHDIYKQRYQDTYGSDANFDQFWDDRVKAFFNHSDFTHQSITMATHLNTIFGIPHLLGRETVEELSGWRGDATDDADVKPSMGIDDYQADIDAVNIIERMNNGISYRQAMTSYYQELNQHSPSAYFREKEFLKHKDLDEVKNTIFNSLVPGIVSKDKKLDYIATNYKDSGVKFFIEQLEAASQN
ncbi:hypothetical protein [Streptococcus pacificus]|uniref:Uncharacterized protein n=1 Tax=Streptococcus pacificus TaxID=2740577 RepID=A0ABS0ZJD8_9STRE|nr:hypothetical protein [Streptococcus pacificus]MBJ8326120.1 hypothetical protein [Streptococcus pacificus]